MEMQDGRYTLFGNKITRSQTKKVIRWQNKFKRMFNYDPDEVYTLHQCKNPYLWDEFGLWDIVRADDIDAFAHIGEQKETVPLDVTDGVIVSTIRMGFGHYRIAMAGVSCARAMGFTPYWLDLLAIPGITTDVINYCNTWYSRFSRMSQRSSLFNTYIWEPVTTGEPSLPGLNALLNAWIVAWPWRYIKTNIKDYKMSELFCNLHQALPQDIPILTSHMWNCMGAVAGGMTKVVDMIFDNWPMAFQLTEGARHGIQSPSGYFGFRTMRGFSEKYHHKVSHVKAKNSSNLLPKPVPEEAVYYVGHHVDHELVENIEIDCQARLDRMNNNEPRRFLLTMGGAGAQRELFKGVIEHSLPLIKSGKMTLMVNLGDHQENWKWLDNQLSQIPAGRDLMTTHSTWQETKEYADSIRSQSTEGLHVFWFNNTAHAVYATNYLMRVVDVLITKPSELAFYPVPKIFNERVGGHEMWGAVRGAEVCDGTCETRTIPQTLQSIDLMTQENDLLTLFCEGILKNKTIGIYDGAYKCVELATGKKFHRK